MYTLYVCQPEVVAGIVDVTDAAAAATEDVVRAVVMFNGLEEGGPGVDFTDSLVGEEVVASFVVAVVIEVFAVEFAVVAVAVVAVVVDVAVLVSALDNKAIVKVTATSIVLPTRPTIRILSTTANLLAFFTR